MVNQYTMFQKFVDMIEDTKAHAEALGCILDTDDHPESEHEELSSIIDDLQGIVTRIKRIKRQHKVPVGSLKTGTLYSKPNGYHVYRVVKPVGELAYGMEDSESNRSILLAVGVSPMGGLVEIDPEKDVVIEDRIYFELYRDENL